MSVIFRITYSILIFLMIMSCKSTSVRPLSAEDIKNIFKDDEYMELSRDTWVPAREKADAAFYYMVGEAKLQKNDLRGTQELFQYAYNTTPNSFYAEKLLSSMLLVTTLTEGEQAARKLMLLYPKSAKIRYYYSLILLRKGAVPEAATELNRSIELNPQYADSYELLTKLYINLDDQKSLKNHLELWQKQIPNSATPYLYMSKYYLTFKNSPAALVHAEEAYSLEPQNPEAMLTYALCLDLNGKYNESIQLYESLFKFIPNNLELIQHMVAVYRTMGELESALALIDQVIGNQSLNKAPQLYLHRALLLWNSNQRSDAAKLFIALHKEFPNDMLFMYFAGFGFEEQHKLDEALSSYDRLVYEPIYSVAAITRRAEILQRSRGNKAAIDEILKIIKEEQIQDPGLSAYLANLYLELNQVARALAVADRAIALYPTNTYLLFLKGHFLERLGRNNEAVAVMHQIIKIDPKHSGAYNFIGYLYIEQGQANEVAKSYIEKALSIKPNDPYYLDSLGWYYFNNKNYKEAEKLLLLSYEQLPNQSEVLEHLIKLYIAKGNKLLASDYLKKAKQLYKDKKLEGVDENAKVIFENLETEIKKMASSV